jgi:hypothetical protein
MSRGRLWLLICVTLIPAPASAHVPPVPVPYTTLAQTPPDRCGKAVGCAISSWHGAPTIFWGDGRASTLEHEKGHLYDWHVLRDRDRGRFRNLFGQLNGNRWSDLPSEWFAEAYSRCSLHTPVGRRSGYGFDPTYRQHALACRMIWDSADLTKSWYGPQT